MYIQQTVLATKSSHIKVLSLMSLIDCLVFKQQKTSLVKHNLPLSHPETSRIYLTPLPLARDVIYGESIIRAFVNIIYTAVCNTDNIIVS